MSDPLNPYPGNLRRHIVDNSDLQVLILRTNDMEGLEHVRDIYEAARAKDAELIQELFDALVQPIVSMDAPIEMLAKAKGAIELAYAHGFKPNEQ